MDYVQIFKLKVEKIMMESNRKYLVKDVDHGFKLINFNSENIYIFEYQKGKWISKIKKREGQKHKIEDKVDLVYLNLLQLIEKENRDLLGITKEELDSDFVFHESMKIWQILLQTLKDEMSDTINQIDIMESQIVVEFKNIKDYYPMVFLNYVHKSQVWVSEYIEFLEVDEVFATYHNQFQQIEMYLDMINNQEPLR